MQHEIAVRERRRQLRKARSLPVGGDLEAACHESAKILKIAPGSPAALHAFGAILASRGELEAAIQFLKRAVALRRTNSHWYSDLGVAFSAAHSWRAAAKAFARSLQLNGGEASTLALYARALRESKQYRPAISAYRRWSQTAPDSCEPCFGSARCLLELRRLPEAQEHAQRGLILNPRSAEGHRLLAEIHCKLLEYDSELGHCLKALRLKAGDPQYQILAAAAYFHAGEIDAALPLFRSAAASGKLASEQYSGLLIALLHHPEPSVQSLVEEHRTWAMRYATDRPPRPPATPPRHARSLRSAKTLRIAYLSGEASSSPGLYFLTPLFRHHDRKDFEIRVYTADSSLVGRFSRRDLAPAELLDVSNWPASKVADRIRKDRIDLLIDVSGHYGGGTLSVMAERPAPVQVSFPTYPSSTGLSCIDYIFTDRWTCLSGQEGQYVEHPYKLKSGYLAYDPPRGAPPVADLPAKSNGAVTFGIFQRPAKLNALIWQAVANIMMRVQGSRLLIHHASAGLDIAGSRSRQRIALELEGRGVAAGRVSFHGVRNMKSHLQLVSSVDISLDSFPYTGQTTTCECLWMGVPVVTVAGNSHASRVSASLMQRVGLHQFVAEDFEAYEENAVSVAGNLNRLAKLRARLRRNVAQSSICDGASLARNIEAAYRWMCARQTAIAGNKPA